MPKIIIDSNRCKACGLCTAVCKKNLIYIDRAAHSAYGSGCAVAKEGCIGCGMCYTVCPDIAITVIRGDNK